MKVAEQVGPARLLNAHTHSHTQGKCVAPHYIKPLCGALMYFALDACGRILELITTKKIHSGTSGASAVFSPSGSQRSLQCPHGISGVSSLLSSSSSRGLFVCETFDNAKRLILCLDGKMFCGPRTGQIQNRTALFVGHLLKLKNQSLKLRVSKKATG